MKMTNKKQKKMPDWLRDEWNGLDAFDKELARFQQSVYKYRQSIYNKEMAWKIGKEYKGQSIYYTNSNEEEYDTLISRFEKFSAQFCKRFEIIDGRKALNKVEQVLKRIYDQIENSLSEND